MSIGPTEVEVERAKSQLKAGLLLGLDGTTAVAEDIGRQLVTSGRRMTPEQIENAVNAVTVDEIKRVAQKYLWDQDVSNHSFNTEALLIISYSSHWPPSATSRACWTTTASVPTCRPWSTRVHRRGFRAHRCTAARCRVASIGHKIPYHWH